ncbi:MAG TPA: hypothetical protein PKA82_09445 [Pyrinomonadaceae bacterium]|nr:hypothetical protein [Pyrinomonadaceae bacterium]
MDLLSSLNPQQVEAVRTTEGPLFFSPIQVAIAIFIGGPIAGGFVLAHNSQQKRETFFSLSFVIAGLSIALWIAWYLIRTPFANLSFVIPIYIAALIMGSLLAALATQLSIGGARTDLTNSANELPWRWSVLVGLTGILVHFSMFLLIFFYFLLQIIES